MSGQSASATPSGEQVRRWHRLFGLLLSDHLSDSPFTVVLEMDLSQKQQLLDVVVVRRRPGKVTRPLPDGLDDLTAHNLISFKSYREPLNDWALKELTGHYVNYRKQVSPRGRLIAEEQFRLIAICARRPRDLFAAVPPEALPPGVYLCRRGTDAIRLVVAAELPREERNALLHLFSAAPEQVQYGAEHYHVHSADMSTIVNDLFANYRVEGLPMPYTIEDYKRERAQGLWPSTEKEVPPEEVLKRFSPEERVQGLSLEERLAGLPAMEVEAYLKHLGKKATAPKKKSKRRR